jgi:hypothetical protein
MILGYVRLDVAAYMEHLQKEAAVPSLMQALAAIRMLFDWLLIGKVLPMTQAAVRGPTRCRKELCNIAERLWRGLDAVFKSRTGAAIKEIHGLFFAQQGKDVREVLQVVV